MPIATLEDGGILNYKLVGGDADVPEVIVEPAFALLLTFFARTIVGENLEARRPFFELHLPVEDDGCRDDDEMRTPYFLFAREM